MKTMQYFSREYLKFILSGILIFFPAFHGGIAYCLESEFYTPNMPTELIIGKQDVSKYQDDKPHPAIINLPTSIVALKQNNGEAFLTELVMYIKNETDDPFEQVKMIHDWVAVSIEYDVAAYKSRDIVAQETLDVLKKGTAVCAGYSRVFKVLCDIAGFPNREISGWSRGERHGWNSVKIDGGWYLVDCTWDAGSVTQNYGEFKFNYKTFYLFTKPEIFIYDHFPDTFDDQLLTSTWTLSQYRNSPYYYRDYFRIVRSGPFIDSRVIEVKGQTYSINLLIDPDFLIGVYMPEKPGEKRVWPGIAKITQIEGGHVTIEVPMPGGPGKYTIIVSATRDDEKVRTGSNSWEQPIHDLVQFDIDFKDTE
jgi:hypothetical protein